MFGNIGVILGLCKGYSGRMKNIMESTNMVSV